jgi:hypothetical protein
MTVLERFCAVAALTATAWVWAELAAGWLP